MATTPSIMKAFELVNKKTQTNGKSNADTTSTLLPTARTRKALDLLISSTPQEIQNLSLRDFLQDLFNWDGNNKVNKPLIRAFTEAINEPYRYPQTVEFVGYICAIAPFLEADQLADMFKVVKDTETAFAPTLYTLNFHNNIKKAFDGLSPIRIAKIAISLWQETHNGRWWNMTAGVNNVQRNQRKVEPETIMKSMLKYDVGNNMENIIWSPENQKNFKTYMRHNLRQDIALLSETFRKDLMNGQAVTPDIAIFLSAIDWLAPNQRPESPINSILRLLVNIRENDDSFIMPKKPNSIKDMFPHVDMLHQANQKFDYPFDPNIVQKVNNKEFLKNIDGAEVHLITSKNALAQNAQYMGNCTLTYEKNMKEGTYALLKIIYQNGEYNASIRLRNHRWTVGEVNSRFNRGNVPTVLRNEITNSVQQLPAINDLYQKYIEQFAKTKDAITYSYML